MESLERLPDVVVRRAGVPAELEGALAAGVLWQAAPDRFLLNVPGVARYYVEAGRSISVEAAPQAGADEVDRFLRMTPLAALLFQRGVLAFHAAAISNGREAYLLAGDSGVGKSTLLASLLQRGWRMCADDLAWVELNENGRPLLRPTEGRIYLWPDALNGLKLSRAESPLPENCRQSYSPRSPQLETEVRPLTALYWLSVHSGQEVEVETLKGAKRFGAFGNLLYNAQIADSLFNRAGFFRAAAAVVQTVPFHRLGRPRGTWSVGELAQLFPCPSTPPSD